MPKTTRSRQKKPRKVDLASRLDMIRQRHRILILEPRKEIEDDLKVDFDDTMDDPFGEGRIDLADLVEVDSY